MRIIVGEKDDLHEAEKDPGAHDVDALHLEKRVVTRMPYPIHKADQDQKANPVDDVETESVGEGNDLKGMRSQFKCKCICAIVLKFVKATYAVARLL